MIEADNTKVICPSCVHQFRAIPVDVQAELSALRDASADAKTDGIAWAVQRWKDEVSLRPLVNVHRRTLDDTWRQVIRYFGGDPDDIIGRSHDELLAGGEQA